MSSLKDPINFYNKDKMFLKYTFKYMFFTMQPCNLMHLCGIRLTFVAYFEQRSTSHISCPFLNVSLRTRHARMLKTHMLSIILTILWSIACRYKAAALWTFVKAPRRNFKVTSTQMK